MYAGIWWADIVASEDRRFDGRKDERRVGEELGRLLRDLPVIELDKKVLGGENQYWRVDQEQYQRVLGAGQLQ